MIRPLQLLVQLLFHPVPELAARWGPLESSLYIQFPIPGGAYRQLVFRQARRLQRWWQVVFPAPPYRPALVYQCTRMPTLTHPYHQ